MTAVTGLNNQPDNGYSGLLQGKVVANDDPLMLQRVKVTVPLLFSEETDIANLPWIGPRSHSPFGIGDNYGTVSVPVVGSRVAVFLQDGKAEYGLLDHDTVNPSFNLPEELTTNYPHRIGMVTPTGDVCYYDVSTGVWFFRHAKGTSIRVDAEGNVFKSVVGNFSEYVKGDYTRIVDGNLTESIKGTATITYGATAYTIKGKLSFTVSDDLMEMVSGKRNTSASSWANSGVLKSADDIIAVNTSLMNHAHPYDDAGHPNVSQPPQA